MLLVVLLCMDLLVLFKVLGPLERLVANLADMRLERRVDTEMRCDVVPLCAGRVAVLPLAGQTQVVGRLATDMLVAQMRI